MNAVFRPCGSIQMFIDVIRAFDRKRVMMLRVPFRASAKYQPKKVVHQFHMSITIYSETETAKSGGMQWTSKRGEAVAPIVLKGTPKRKRNHLRDRLNAAVKALAPVIAAIRAEGVIGVEEIRDRLNAEGVAAPNGGKFTTGSMFRIMERLAELGLGPGPRSASQALTDRWERKAKEMKEKLDQVIAEQKSRREGRTSDSAFTRRSFTRGDDNQRDEGIERQ